MTSGENWFRLVKTNWLKQEQPVFGSDSTILIILNTLRVLTVIEAGLTVRLYVCVCVCEAVLPPWGKP